uniref:Selenoprotein P N-terminal domain-containing protein n=1 Tax=Monodon monoceros TaxID=40151 RepID=A0A8C6AV46_MONMO
MWRGLGLALALCLLPTGGTESQGQSSFCKQPPAWSIKDQDPMLNSYGSVTVVALLQASYLCILQASRHWKMKTSVKMYLWLLRKKQPRLHSPITITITILRTVIFQSIQNQKHQITLSIPLLQVFIATIGTGVTKDRVTQRTEMHYNFLFHKRSSDEVDA